jgi:hypothetical protein
MNSAVERVIRMSEQEFSKKITASGAEFYFLKLNGKANETKRLGVKVSQARESGFVDREETYKAQMRAYKKGLGPPVGLKVTLIVKDTFDTYIYYGYETGICLKMRGRNITKRLESALAKAKLDRDLHSNNVGIWKGKQVLIDFGNYSRGY